MREVLSPYGSSPLGFLIRFPPQSMALRIRANVFLLTRPYVISVRMAYGDKFSAG